MENPFLNDKEASGLPQKSDWHNCCVPFNLLLEKYRLQVRRQKFKRGMAVYLVWLLLVLALTMLTFSGNDSVLALMGIMIRTQITGNALLRENYTLLNSYSGEAFTLSPTNAPSLSPTNGPPSTGAPVASPTPPPSARRLQTSSNSPQYMEVSILVEPSQGRLGVDEFLSYFGSLFSFDLCQPNDISGLCISRGYSSQQRSPVYEGSRAISESESCLANQDMNSIAYNDTNVVCQTVLQTEPSSPLCFSGFSNGQAVNASSSLNNFWGNNVNNASGNRMIDSSLNGCGALPYGWVSGCFFSTSNWHTYLFDLNVSDFQNRVDGIKFLTSTLDQSETYPTNDTQRTFTWFDENTLISSTMFTRRSDPGSSVVLFKLNFQHTLAGSVGTVNRVYALGGNVFPAVGEVSALGVATCVLFAAVVVLLFWGLIYPVVRAFWTQEDTWTGIKHYFNYSNIWDFLDLVLLILFTVSFINLLRYGFVYGIAAVNSLSDDGCATEQYLRNVGITKQVVGFTCLLVFLRFFKYISLIPSLQVTWRAMVKGIYYFLPALMMLICCWLTIAFCTMVVLNGYSRLFNNYYNALVAVITMYADGGGTSWHAVFAQPGFGVSEARSLSLESLEKNALTVGILFIYKFFLVVPFTALSISAFYYAVVFTNMQYENKLEQERMEKNISNVQSVLTQVKQQEDQERNGVRLKPTARVEFETRLDCILVDVEDQEDNTNLQQANDEPRGWDKFKILCTNCMSDARLFLSSSTKETTMTERYSAFANSNYIKDKDALFRLQVFSSKIENKCKAFISYEEIENIVGSISRSKRVYVPRERIVEIMDIVGQGNVYSNDVKQKYEAEMLMKQSRGETVRAPTAGEIAEREKRRRRMNLDNWQEVKTEDAVIHEMAEKVRKLHEQTNVAVKILHCELSDFNARQQDILDMISRSMYDLKQIQANQ